MILNPNLMILKRHNFNKRLSNFSRLSRGSIRSSKSASFSKFSKMGDGISAINESLVRAGFLFIDEQLRFKFIRNLIFFSSEFCLLILALILGKSALRAVVLFVIGTYVILLINVVWLKFRRSQVEREVYYETPLFLEELVLLISSGLALFPALQSLSQEIPNCSSLGVVRRYLNRVYMLASHGLPVSEAFEQVARACPFPPIQNVLLHLEVSSSVGGELIFALQSLASQVHTEWKLAVETRVKKLENLVVFPVFAAVIGMMLLTAAVPLVPIMDFMGTLKNSQSERQFKDDGILLQKSPRISHQGG